MAGAFKSRFAHMLAKERNWVSAQNPERAFAYSQRELPKNGKLKIFRSLCLLFIFGSLAVLPSFGLTSSSVRQKVAKPRTSAASFQVTLDPATVNFPTRPVGAASLPVTIALSNYTSSSDTLVITSIVTSGDFSQTNTCGTGVPGGGQCYIFVTFTPIALGSRSGTLTVTDNAANSPETVALTGFAAPAGIGSSSAVAASSGLTGAYTLTGAVTGTRGAGSPTGTVSFLDTTNNGISLGQAALGLGTAGLSLANGPSHLTGTEPTQEAVADFNGDGKLDLAVNFCTNPDCLFPMVSVFLGNGDGTFTQSASFAGHYDLIIGDFNGDGKPDIAVGLSGISYLVEFGNGDGTFTAQSVSLTPFDPYLSCFASADFNGDGNADLVCVGSNNTATVILLGQKNGSFVSAAGNPFSGGVTYGVVVGDFNGDGKPDFAVLDSPLALDLSVEVSLGNGDGTFQSPVSTHIGSQLTPHGRDGVVGDINGDGKSDLAIEGSVTKGAAVSDGFMALLSKGDGSFTLGPAIPIAPSPTFNGQTGHSSSGGIAVKDVNGDGKADVAVLNDDVAQVLLSNGDGTFTVAEAADSGAETDPVWEAVVFGDLNGDGLPDLVGMNSDAGDVTVYFTEHTETAVATLANVTVPGTGSHSLTAVYAGDTNFSASTSSAIALIASPVVSKLSLTSSAASPSAGTQLTLTATITPYSFDSLVTNNEKVTFSNNGTSIGTGNLSSGVATLNIASLPVGTDNVTAAYGGDSNFAPATSNAVSVIVAVGGPSIALSSGSSALTIASQGGSTTTPIKLSVADGFTGTVSLTCVVTYQGQSSPTDPPTCSLDPAQVQIAQGTPSPSTLTVSTTATTGSAAHDNYFKSTGLVFAALLFVGVLPRRRLRGGMLLVFLGVTVIGGVLGCGGSHSTPGTTTGNYQVVVTATSGKSVASTTISLNLQ